MRLIARLPPESVEAHLLHFGGFPEDDPLLSTMLPKLPCHELGLGHPYAALRRLYKTILPDVVVLGEGPCGGMMSVAYESANDLGLRLICIENLYHSDQQERYVRDTPAVDQWLLLGLPLGHHFGRITSKAVLAPPLLPNVDARVPGSPEITILGYDVRVAQFGLELVSRLPDGVTARLVLAEETRRVASWRHASAGRRVLLSKLPSETRLASYLKSSRIVVCKSGFQQMVESLALGTPVIVYSAPGGIPEAWLPRDLQLFVRYFPDSTSDWSRPLSAAAVWLSRRPVMPWTRELKSIPDRIQYAADLLFGLLSR